MPTSDGTKARDRRRRSRTQRRTSEPLRRTSSSPRRRAANRPVGEDVNRPEMGSHDDPRRADLLRGRRRLGRRGHHEQPRRTQVTLRRLDVPVRAGPPGHVAVVHTRAGGRRGRRPIQGVLDPVERRAQHPAREQGRKQDPDCCVPESVHDRKGTDVNNHYPSRLIPPPVPRVYKPTYAHPFRPVPSSGRMSLKVGGRIVLPTNGKGPLPASPSFLAKPNHGGQMSPRLPGSANVQPP